MEEKQSENTALVSRSAGRLLPVASLGTIVSTAAIIFLVYAFFSGLAMEFYASFVFLFYSWTGSMWISVVMLGVFQTLLLIPFRIINLLKSQSLDKFKDTTEKEVLEKHDSFLKKEFRTGGRVALYYVVNFFAALVSYASIGRLFLTDFYTHPLDPTWLYSFVPYPTYPIADRFFRIPYTWFTETHDFGSSVVWWTWIILIILQMIIYIGLYVARKRKVLAPTASISVSRLTTGNLLLLMILSWWLVRNFPVEWRFFIFSGDVGMPNKTLNTITALATFITLIWGNLPKIRGQVELARAAGYDDKIILRTQKELLQETLKVAGFVGLGAYYITNLIPSAFELSIFTLEIISWVSPFTLDKLILTGLKNKQLAAAATLREEQTAGESINSSSQESASSDQHQS